MGILQTFGWSTFPSIPSAELPEIFPFRHVRGDFIKNDIVTIYSRILKDVFERTQGLSTDQMTLIWDNCVGSNKSDGLVTLLAEAMYMKTKLFVVYNAPLKVVRKAEEPEKVQILADYKKSGESPVGVFIDFSNFKTTDMMLIYSELTYHTIASLYKSMNLSKSIQLKFSDMRASTGVIDAADIIAQAQSMAKGMNEGKDVAMDAKDNIETATPDLTATQSSMDFIAQKQSFYLGVPSSYITGLAPKGLGDSGLGDAKAVERGLKNYYFSIVKPVVEKLFKATTTFKSEDYNGMTTALEALKTFTLMNGDNTLISQENKQLIIGKLFGLETNK